MADLQEPAARLGVILSSGNRTLEPYFRALAPAGLGLHVTRMRMGSGGRRRQTDMEGEALRAAELLADAHVDAIDLQGTGIMMERGPDGEAALVAGIARATNTPVYTATQSVVEALHALGLTRIATVNPGNGGSVARETGYFAAAGITVANALARDLGDDTFEVTPAQWLADAQAVDCAAAQGIFLSGSHTRMVEAIAEIEAATGKPVVTSIQAALWAGLRRLPGLGANLGYGATPPAALGMLFRSR